jgi:metal-sulfur cluster biosynthetic enzyme
MSQDIQQTRRLIFDELSKIVDPEIGVSIMELELIDKVDIEEKDVNVDFHLTSPFCPAVFGFKIAQDVRDNIYKIEGIENVKINVSNHFMAEAINKQVNESKLPSKGEGEGEEEENQQDSREQQQQPQESKQQD